MDFLKTSKGIPWHFSFFFCVMCNHNKAQVCPIHAKRCRSSLLLVAEHSRGNTTLNTTMGTRFRTNSLSLRGAFERCILARSSEPRLGFYSSTSFRTGVCVSLTRKKKKEEREKWILFASGRVATYHFYK